MTTPPYTSRAVDGATFVLDDPRAELEPRWGTRDGDLAWQRGESLMLVGPTGVGKTTVAIQIIGGLLGIEDAFLGMPIEPAARVLYLALDRPRQIMRAMRRYFGEEHRELLDQRLTVWSGPLPFDIGRKPEFLPALAHDLGAEVLFADSAKDLTAKIADDEAGSNINRAIQMCLADDIDVAVAHHQRKGQDGRRPKTLEDVYGSTWLTAGAGSVILLWGEAGSELVELEHLKQPGEPIGPWRLEHDHHAGRTIIARGFDVLTYLRRHPGGMTLVQIAQAQWGAPATDAQRKKTERKLRQLARLDRPLVFQRSAGSFEAATWWAAEIDATLVDTLVDTPPSEPDRGRTADTNGHSPTNTVDTSVDTHGHAEPWTRAYPLNRGTAPGSPEETAEEDAADGRAALPIDPDLVPEDDAREALVRGDLLATEVAWEPGP